MLKEIPYDRKAAFHYASTWAFGRNPAYYDYTGIGGDCTNFVSQCLYAGCGVMNYTPTFGWYYRSPNDKSPSWTGVPYLYNFLTSNKETGPYAVETEAVVLEVGDVIQLQNESGQFYHTLIITQTGPVPNVSNILIASHANDAFNRPLSSYNYAGLRFLHILGARKWE